MHQIMFLLFAACLMQGKGIETQREEKTERTRAIITKQEDKKQKILMLNNICNRVFQTPELSFQLCMYDLD